MATTKTTTAKKPTAKPTTNTAKLEKQVQALEEKVAQLEEQLASVASNSTNSGGVSAAQVAKALKTMGARDWQVAQLTK